MGKDKPNGLYSILLALIFLEPLVFNPWGSSAFTLSKLTFLHLLTLTLFLVFLAGLARKEKITLVKSSLFLPILFLFIASLLSTLFSVHQQTSLGGLYSLINFILIYFLLINIAGEKEARMLITLSLIVGSVVSLYGIFQRLGLDVISWNDPNVYLRPSSSCGNPDFLAAYLVIIIPLAISRLLEKEGLKKILYLLISFLLFSSLLITLARAGYLSLLFSGLVLILLIGKRIIKENKRWLLALFSGFILIALLLFIPRVHLGGEKTSLFKQINLRSSSVKIRLYLFRDAIFIFSMHPFFGWGLNTFPLAYPYHRSVEISRLQATTALPEDAHNQILQIAVCSGLVGLFASFFLLIAYLSLIYGRCRMPEVRGQRTEERCQKKDVRSQKSEKPWTMDCGLWTTEPWTMDYGLREEDGRRLQLAGLVAGMSAFMVQSLFNPLTPDTRLLFWGILGITMIYRGRGREDRGQGTERVNSQQSTVNRGQKKLWTMDYGLWTEKRGEEKVEASPPLFRQVIIYVLILLLIFFLIPAIINPFLADLFFRKAKEYSRQGEVDKAVLRYYRAIELDSKNPSYHRQLALTYKGVAQITLQSGGDGELWFKKAEEEYKGVVELNPLDGSSYSDLGRLYGYWGQTLDKSKFKVAIDEYKKAIKLDPNYAIFHNDLGIVYLNQAEIQGQLLGDFSLAIKEFKKAQRLVPNFEEPYLNLGITYHKMGKKDMAAEEFKKASRLRGNSQ